MAVTALEVKTPNGIVKSKVVTTPTEHGLYIQLFRCNDNWVEQPPAQEFGAEEDEEVYHKELRAGAMKANHFVQGESTNPEWTPKDK